MRSTASEYEKLDVFDAIKYSSVMKKSRRRCAKAEIRHF
jgi:hypothetical protein